jgi:hypothetical protein
LYVLLPNSHTRSAETLGVGTVFDNSAWPKHVMFGAVPYQTAPGGSTIDHTYAPFTFGVLPEGQGGPGG